MHEMSLMASIFDILTRHLEDYPGVTVKKVTLRIGSLTNAVPEALEFCFSAFAQGTVVEGAQLEIIQVPIKIKCRECQQESEPVEFHFRCPGCGSLAVDVTQGRELALESMEVE
ncbi:MAG: hydrogenase maturation nickel metallochaperone HypA [Clostridia bacterium]|nr:hydrogenase maturation nickel metallochaperone HypA [Clostridia bacterium]